MNQNLRVSLRVDRLDDRINPVVSAYDIAEIVDAADNPGLIGVVNIGPDATDLNCTGALLADGRYILTAAHCVDDNGDKQADEQTYFVRFDFADREFLFSVDKSAITVHPDWTGSVGGGSDLAVFELPALAPYGKNLGYELYTDRDELFRTATFVGFGRIGTGTTGELAANNPRTLKSYLPEVQRLRVDGTGPVTLGFNGESVTLTAPFTAVDLREAIEGFSGVDTVIVGRAEVETNPFYGAFEVGFIQIDDALPGFANYNVPELTITEESGFVGRSGVRTLTDGTSEPLKRMGSVYWDRFDTLGGIGSSFPSVRGESALGGGDSGGPAFLNGKIAGVASYGMGDTKIGDPTFWARVSDFTDSFLFPLLSQAQPVVLDMAFQPDESDGKADVVKVYSENFRLIITVNGEQYFNAPMSRVSELKIRGATDPLRIEAIGNFGIPTSYTGTQNVAVQQFPWVALASASGETPVVHLVSLDSGATQLSINPFEATFTGGVSVAMGDVTGDAIPDVIVGAGPGGGPAVKVYNGQTGELVSSFFAFDEEFTGGVNVAVGDLDGDAIPEIVVAAASGGGPHIRAIDVRTGAIERNFFAYAEDFTGGVSVAVGDIDNDRHGDIVVGAGPGGGPHVQVFSGRTGDVIRSFFAMNPDFTGGVNVASGDLTGNESDDIIVGARSGGGPRVTTFDGQTNDPVLSYFAFDPTFTGGVFVAGGQPGGRSGVVLAGAGKTGPSTVPVINAHTGELMQTLAAFPDDFLGGVQVALANDPGGTIQTDPVPLPSDVV